MTMTDPREIARVAADQKRLARTSMTKGEVEILGKDWLKKQCELQRLYTIEGAALGFLGTLGRRDGVPSGFTKDSMDHAIVLDALLQQEEE